MSLEIQQFLDLIQKNFPEVVKTNSASTLNRTILFVPNQKRNKRWIKIDNNESLHISFDFCLGDISEADCLSAGLPVRKNGRYGYKITDDAVHVTLTDVNVLLSEAMLPFLHKVYSSYLKRVELK
ncbi:hypothetical protein ACFWGC_29295 [Cytobacillus pseudoceanisediminis]|uniref:hypothetical protein n=1 Tax=Bacillaceae TaxID=186817 RepID=UPI001A8DD9F7|nr:hypothetical protein [Bacillus sp. NTK034]MBN8199187.1 hypothetical protein [Bacillus sp. NTK034]